MKGVPIDKCSECPFSIDSDDIGIWTGKSPEWSGLGCRYKASLNIESFRQVNPHFIDKDCELPDIKLEDGD